MNVSKEDISWTRERAIELVKDGKAANVVQAIQMAANEVVQRKLDQELAELSAHQEMLDRQSDERRQKRDQEFAKLRADLQARATPAQRPTLKASLGDLIRAKVKP